MPQPVRGGLPMRPGELALSQTQTSATLYIKHCIVRNSTEFEYEALDNKETVHNFLIVYALCVFICKCPHYDTVRYLGYLG